MKLIANREGISWKKVRPRTRMIRESGISATILRPWYVLGPGHRWAYVTIPFYKLAELTPWWREGARRLGLVTIHQMVNALVRAIETDPGGARIWEPPQIRGSR